MDDLCASRLGASMLVADQPEAGRAKSHLCSSMLMIRPHAIMSGDDGHLQQQQRAIYIQFPSGGDTDESKQVVWVQKEWPTIKLSQEQTRERPMKCKFVWLAGWLAGLADRQTGVCASHVVVVIILARRASFVMVVVFNCSSQQVVVAQRRRRRRRRPR